MTRAKRALQETDANASMSQPRTKSARTLKSNSPGSNKDTLQRQKKSKNDNIENETQIPPFKESTASPGNTISTLRRSTRQAASRTGKLHEEDNPVSNTVRTISGPSKIFHDEQGGPLGLDGNEVFEYHNKDNSKLRRFLLERDLDTAGTREELISRLENSSINYNYFTSDQLSDMLRGRDVIGAASTSKQTKIERLRINDMMARDMGHHGDGDLYCEAWVFEMLVDDDMGKTYRKMKPQKIVSLLKDRKLKVSGDKEAQIKRLMDDNIVMKARCKEELEDAIGRKIIGSVKGDESRSNVFARMDSQVRGNSKPTKILGPTCDYDWKQSRWAKRNERDLREICIRRGMEGWGTKATCIKWLDTGKVELEDLAACALETMCYKRDIKYRYGAKKAELIELLRANNVV